MALTIVASFPVAFSVIGDGITTTLAVDVSQEPFAVSSSIKRVVDLVVTGVAGLTATRTFSGTTVTLTFSAAFVGIATVHFVVLT